jgi:hypothetical protein
MRGGFIQIAYQLLALNGFLRDEGPSELGILRDGSLGPHCGLSGPSIRIIEGRPIDEL